MGRLADSKKWSVWRRRLKRFERSQRSVVKFCESEGVSPASFYLWRKKIAAVDAAAERTSDGERFAPVTVVRAATLVAELPGGTRLEVPAGDVRLLRAAIDQFVSADARTGGGAS